MSAVKGDTRSLREFAKRLRAVPTKAAITIAKAAAPKISALASAAYDGGQTVHGTARPGGVSGPLTLVQSGATRAQVRFVSDGGTKIRAVLGTKYARYLIGKYQILPSGALPTVWAQLLGKVAADELAALLAGGA